MKFRYTSLTAASCLLALTIASSLAQDNQLRSPSEIDGSKLQGGKPAVQQPAPEPAMTQRAQVAEQLLREMDNLIPGKFEPESEDRTAMVNIISAFQDREGPKVVEMVEAFAKRNSDYPPADVLLAALSYSTQDEKTGVLLLERASRKHPEDPAVYSAFARLAINGGRTTDAKVLFEKLKSTVDASALSADGKDFYYTQYLDGMIDIAVKQQRYTDARELLKQQRVKLPDHPKVLMVSAELEFKEDKLDKCLEFLTQMKTKYPKTRSPEAIVASWYERTNNPTKADEWIRKAAELYPKDPQVQLEFASWALNKEDFPTASMAVGRAEAASRETPFSKNLKAKIAFARESYGLAEAHYESLVASQPMDSDLSNMYALSLIESKDPEKRAKAAGIASRNYRAMPNNRIALASLGFIQLKLGDKEQAGAAFTRASQMNGASSPEIDYFFASYLKQAGEIANAKQFLDRALAQNGLFLYRSAALKLQKELAASELPTPKK